MDFVPLVIDHIFNKIRYLGSHYIVVLEVCIQCSEASGEAANAWLIRLLLVFLPDIRDMFKKKM